MDTATIRTQREGEQVACDDARASAWMLGCALLLPIALVVLGLLFAAASFILS